MHFVFLRRCVFSLLSVALIVSFVLISVVAQAAAEARVASNVAPANAQRAPAMAVDPAATTLLRVRELLKRGDRETALQRLNGEWGQQLAKVDAEPISRFLKARILEDLKRDTEAAAEYTRALEKKNPLEIQIRYAAGRLYARTGQDALARENFSRVLEAPKKEVPAALRARAVLELARVVAARASSDTVSSAPWKEVVRILQPALKSARGQDIYPSYVHLLLRARRHLGVSECRLARDLYSKYPAAPEISDWGPLLPNNKVDGKNLSCSATAKDIQTRLRRLQLQGQVERSIGEIHSLKSVGVFDTWTLDSFEIGALLSNGKNEEAMVLLLKHAEAQKTRPQFWNHMGRITSRMGDFASSAGAYKKSYQLAPRGRAASDALFNSAFASYQMQDYDGAEEGFGLLSKKYGRAKIARDARWHLAWMSYLRGDFETALARWQSLLKERIGRRQARTDSTSRDRIQYWSGMAFLRLGREKEATEMFRQLLRDPSIDYYAILSWYRLKSIPGVVLTDAENRLGFTRGLAEQELRETIAAETFDAKVEVEKAKAAADPVVANEPPVSDVAAESEDEAPLEAETADTITDAGTEAGDEAKDADEAGSDVDGLAIVDGRSVQVRDPALRPRLDRVRQLFAAGFLDESRWELRNLDASVRNPQDRRMMMAELHRMGRYDRSSTLGELAFSGPRLRGGLKGARDLWEFTYPQAFSEVVLSSAKTTRVEADLIWSIMRAESHYRTEARSPVGASGLMQIMPFTGERISSQLLSEKGFKAVDLMEADFNIRFGARYLQRLQEKFNRSLPLVAAGYNAGPHRVQSWLKGFGALRMDEFIEHIPFVETRNYVKKVTRNFQIYRLLYRDDRGSLDWLVKPVGVSPDSSPEALEVW